MNTHTTMLTSDPVFSSNLVNKGFVILDAMFKEYGWVLVRNEKTWINYTKPGDETSFFDIKVLADKIVVSVPIKQSTYQYITTFKDYYQASEFIEQKLKDYMAKPGVTI